MSFKFVLFTNNTQDSKCQIHFARLKTELQDSILLNLGCNFLSRFFGMTFT